MIMTMTITNKNLTDFL